MNVNDKKPQNDDAGGLPVYDSMQSCAAATEIPIAVIKQAKRGGCSAFRSNRVALKPLLSWIFKQSDEDIDWGNDLKKWKAKREKIAHDKDAGRSLDSDEVKACVSQGVSILFTELDRLFCNELPPVLKGLDEIEIFKRCKAAIEAVKAAAHAKFKELNKPTDE